MTGVIFIWLSNEMLFPVAA